ncbi:MAG: hypothetical protein MZV70_60770 [Desulfobacterales bacterium]|nr:hypothetical protein [Desulfobacterales bacterium]
MLDLAYTAAALLLGLIALQALQALLRRCTCWSRSPSRLSSGIGPRGRPLQHGAVPDLFHRGRHPLARRPRAPGFRLDAAAGAGYHPFRQPLLGQLIDEPIL